MGFLAGRLSCCRFRAAGRSLGSFGPDHLEHLAANAIDQQRVALADGSQAGWIAADHILDTRFELAKNIVNDCLHFALRVDTQAIPGDLLRAYTLMELAALAENNPSGLPSGRQLRQARMLAKERLEQEAKDGRFLKRKAVPVLWDAPAGEVLVGTTSVTALDRLVPLFHKTFNRRLEPLGAGAQAFAHAEASGQTRGVDDARASVFVSGQTPQIYWLPDPATRDFLGNEFLVWLWYFLDNEDDTIKLGDDSTVTVMLTRTLVLECPRGQTGRETISSEGPTRLPESLRALQAGKLPRKIGMILNRQDNQFELTLQAETLALGGARLPPAEGENERARMEERVTLVRHLLETLDLLYQAFCQRRLGADWTGELGKIKKWLQR